MVQVMQFTPDGQAHLRAEAPRSLAERLTYLEGIRTPEVRHTLASILSIATQIRGDFYVLQTSNAELAEVMGLCRRTVQSRIKQLVDLELTSILVTSDEHGQMFEIDLSRYYEGGAAGGEVPRATGGEATKQEGVQYPVQRRVQSDSGTEAATRTGVTIPSKNTTYSSRVSESNAPTHTPARADSPVRQFALRLHGFIEQKYAEMGIRVDDLNDLSEPLLQVGSGAWEADALFDHIKRELPAYRMRCRSTKSALSALLGDMNRRGITPESLAVLAAPSAPAKSDTPDLNAASNQLAAWGV